MGRRIFRVVQEMNGPIRIALNNFARRGLSLFTEVASLADATISLSEVKWRNAIDRDPESTPDATC